MARCSLYRDAERLKIPEPECGHTGERLIGHNLALDKAIKVLEECPRFPPSGYTSWYVLLRRRDDGSWEPIGCVEDCTEDEEALALLEEPFNLILPIPNPEGIPEWDGF